MTTNRRCFLMSSVVAGLAAPNLLLRSASAQTKPASPNDRPGIGAIGMRYQGTVITLKAQAHGDVVAIADVDRNVREQARAGFGSGARRATHAGRVREVQRPLASRLRQCRRELFPRTSSGAQRRSI